MPTNDDDVASRKTVLDRNLIANSHVQSGRSFRVLRY